MLKVRRRDDLCIKAYVCKLGDKNMLLEALFRWYQRVWKVGEEKEIKHQYPADYFAEELKGQRDHVQS